MTEHKPAPADAKAEGHKLAAQINDNYVQRKNEQSFYVDINAAAVLISQALSAAHQRGWAEAVEKCNLIEEDIREQAHQRGYGEGLEEAAKVAKAHNGSAARERSKKRPIKDPDAFLEIHAEERGEDIASELIERKILSLRKAEREGGE